MILDRSPQRLGSPPRRERYSRVHVTLSEPLMKYLERAWRMHIRPDGSYARGVSAFIEDLVLEHRNREERRPRL